VTPLARSPAPAPASVMDVVPAAVGVCRGNRFRLREAEAIGRSCGTYCLGLGTTEAIASGERGATDASASGEWGATDAIASGEWGATEAIASGERGATDASASGEVGR
jgi:hypothetical protein